MNHRPLSFCATACSWRLAKELGIKAHMDAIDHLRASNWTILPLVML